MSFNATLRVGVATAAIAVFCASPMTAAAKGDNPARLRRLHHERAQYVTYRPHRVMERDTLPYRPEYGFLSHVPSNAIRMPGYTFVPGVGILGESCDLPTSACSNRYRDIE
jgi:hypothetical protein